MGSAGRGSRPRCTSADAAAHAGPGGDPAKYVYRYFKGLLNEWEEEMGARGEEEKSAPSGLADTRMLKQCKDFVRPFFRALRNKSAPPDIVTLCAEVVDHCRAGCVVWVGVGVSSPGGPLSRAHSARSTHTCACRPAPHTHTRAPTRTRAQELPHGRRRLHPHGHR